MKSSNRYTITFLILVSFLVIADLVIKSLIINHLEVGERFIVIDNFFSIARVPTLHMSFGFQEGHQIVAVVKILFHILILLLMLRIQKLDVNKLFKYSTVLIVFGYIGNHLDKILFSNGESNYVHTGYINLSLLNNYVNLSSIMVFIGWVLLIISIILSSKDLKVIFSLKERN